MGSPRFTTVDTTLCRVVDAWFAPWDVLPAHTHDRPIVAVMMEGSFETRIGQRRLECTPRRVWTEPCEETHANFIGRRGARVLVMQPDPARRDVFAPFQRLTDDVHLFESRVVALEAHRLLREMRQTDALAPIAIDAVILALLVQTGRQLQHRHRRRPDWLRRVQELLHEGFRAPPSITEMAAIAGVTPSHLCHAFRHHVGTSIGDYVRAVRLEWALDRLRCSDDTVAAVAASAGYADHSHFTRECRRRLGMPPSEVRRAGRS